MSICNRIEQDPRNEWAARANKHCARGWRNKQTDVVNKQVATKSSKITARLLFLQSSYFLCLWWPRDEDLECGNSCLCLPPLYARNSRWDGRFLRCWSSRCVEKPNQWIFKRTIRSPLLFKTAKLLKFSASRSRFFFREISVLIQVSVKVLSFVCFSFCRNSRNEFFRRVSLLLGNVCYKQMLLQNCKTDFAKKLMVRQGIKPGYSPALSDFVRDLKFLRKI